MNKFFIVQCLPETVRFMGSLIFLLVMQNSLLKKPMKFKNVGKKENSWVTLMRKKVFHMMLLGHPTASHLEP